MEHNVNVATENDQKKQITTDLNVDILPSIYEIIRSVEKDHHDNSGKSRESQDCSQKVLELQKKLVEIRSQIRHLPGIDYSKEQQLKNLEALKAQLQLKQELLHKYRIYPFDIQKF